MNTKNPQQERDENVVKLLTVIFHDYFCVSENIDKNKKGFVIPAFFFGWLDSKCDYLLPKEEICEKAGVGNDIWDFLIEIVKSGLAPERLYQVWYIVILSDRKAPSVQVKTCNLVMLITFEDGRIWPTQSFVSREMLFDNQGFSDGLLASIISKNSQAFTQTIIEEGLESLHSKAKNYRTSTPEDPFDVLMGLVLKVLPQLEAKYQEPVRDYLRLCQGILRPLIPQHIKAQIEKAKNKPTGGWEE